MQRQPGDVVGELLRVPAPLEQLDPAVLPAKAGFYAWWVRGGELPDVPRVPHPVVEGVALLYVGISPARASSSQTVRSRVLGNRVGGNTGSSTFRFTLASLLRGQMGFEPYQTGSKTVLSRGDNDRLTGWQRQHLALTWSTCAEPWAIEAAVIARMAPPLNLASNAASHFHARLSAARSAFREAAKGTPNL